MSVKTQGTDVKSGNFTVQESDLLDYKLTKLQLSYTELIQSSNTCAGCTAHCTQLKAVLTDIHMQLKTS